MKRVPMGCDQQGRYPQAAEACSEYGADDGLDDDPVGVKLLVVSAMLVISMMFTIAVAWLTPGPNLCEFSEFSPDIKGSVKEQCRKAKR